MRMIRLTASIIGLPCTAAEKILFAYLCAQAAGAGGSCCDSNGELAQAVGMHPQTISTLIGRLSATPLLEAATDPVRANHRTLTPAAEFLNEYTKQPAGRVDNAPPAESIAFRSPGKRPVSRPFRVCPISGLDISRQRADVRLASRTTLLRLASHDQVVFDILSARLLPPPLLGESVAVRSHHLAHTIRQRAARYLYA